MQYCNSGIKGDQKPPSQNAWSVGFRHCAIMIGQRVWPQQLYKQLAAGQTDQILKGQSLVETKPCFACSELKYNSSFYNKSVKSII